MLRKHAYLCIIENDDTKPTLNSILLNEIAINCNIICHKIDNYAVTKLYFQAICHHLTTI